MLRRPLSATTLLVLVGAMSGCASTPKGGSLSDYVGGYPINVTTTCGGGFQVYRQPVNGRVLVVAYAVSEMRQSFCQSWRGEPSVSAVTGVRHEDAALEFISQTPALKGCALTSGVEITRLHSEFIMACPTAPGAGVVQAKG
jgi:hypothetical protein